MLDLSRSPCYTGNGSGKVLEAICCNKKSENLKTIVDFNHVFVACYQVCYETF